MKGRRSRGLFFEGSIFEKANEILDKQMKYLHRNIHGICVQHRAIEPQSPVWAVPLETRSVQIWDFGPSHNKNRGIFLLCSFLWRFQDSKRHQFDNHLSSFEDWGDQNQKNVFQRKMVKVRVCQVSKEWSRREGWVGIFLRLRCWIIMLISKEKRIINILLTLCSFHPKQLCILWKG